MQNLKPLASLSSWAGQFESYLVGNPEDRFYRDEAHLQVLFCAVLSKISHSGDNPQIDGFILE